MDGKFEGFIQSHQGTYYVEPAERYLKDRDVPYHSVIYHEDDIGESVLLSLRARRMVLFPTFHYDVFFFKCLVV